MYTNFHSMFRLAFNEAFSSWRRTITRRWACTWYNTQRKPACRMGAWNESCEIMLPGSRIGMCAIRKYGRRSEFRWWFMERYSSDLQLEHCSSGNLSFHTWTRRRCVCMAELVFVSFFFALFCSLDGDFAYFQGFCEFTQFLDLCGIFHSTRLPLRFSWDPRFHSPGTRLDNTYPFCSFSSLRDYLVLTEKKKSQFWTAFWSI